MKKILKICMYIFITISIFILGILIFTKTADVFGGKPNEKRQGKISSSVNFSEGVFNNLVSTSVSGKNPDLMLDSSQRRSFFGFFFPRVGKNPRVDLPSEKFNKDNFNTGSFAWLGHSTLLMNLDEKNILVDPVFFEASPVSFFGKSFSFKNKTQISDLPESIDYVLISHDHYDHLDMKSIQRIHSRVEKFLVPLAVGSHLEKWGVPSEKIFEFDWYEELEEKGLRIVFTPSRHFSGRSFKRYDTLWGSWVLKSKNEKVYYSGDGGYSETFSEIGEKYGPFDLAFMESGAYDQNWAEIHMYPEESVQAGIDVHAKLLMPVHWAKFDLALHHWAAPIKRFSKAAQEKNISITTPLPGQIFTIENAPNNVWWELES